MNENNIDNNDYSASQTETSRFRNVAFYGHDTTSGRTRNFKWFLLV